MPLPISDDHTGGTLHDKLAVIDAHLFRESLQLLDTGPFVARPQNEREATYAPLIHKDDGRIDWHQDAPTLERRIRACNPWPPAYTTVHGRLLKIFAAFFFYFPRPPPPPPSFPEGPPAS